MYSKKSKKLVYVKWLRKGRAADPVQLAIMLGFIFITTLVSLWLPMYFTMVFLRDL